ncbi:MAG: ROK family protein [Rhodospirillales bacterium]|nr:ROK family protein [Rhodospirillales bacterium]
MSKHRIGIDLGGTKIEIAVLGPDGAECLRHRIPTPKGYDAAVEAIAGLVEQAEAKLSIAATVGIGIPGAISPKTGLVKNANSNALNGHAFDRDISARLKRTVRVENDANCFALSEASDGAGKGHDLVFGVILGTGVGGGIVYRGRLHAGPHRIAAEWGHNPLPWPGVWELPGVHCWCGNWNCLETVLSGPALARDCDGPEAHDASTIEARAEAGERRAQAALARHAERLARGLAHIVNLIDPDVIVLGGGLSNMVHLYRDLPGLLPRHVFSDAAETPIVKNVHGDSSGVRGAAWLWQAGEDDGRAVS